MTLLPLLVLVLVPVAALAALARAIFLGYPRPSFRGAALDAREQAIVAAAADALFPSGGPIPISGTQAGLVRYTDESLAHLPPHTRGLLRLLFVFVEHGPWLFGPKRARFTRLPQADRIAALQCMQTSRIYFRRIAFLSLRTLLSMGYLANDAVARAIGVVQSAAPFDAERSAREAASEPARALVSPLSQVHA